MPNHQTTEEGTEHRVRVNAGERHVACVSQSDRSGPVSTMVPHFPKMMQTMQTKHWVSDSGKVPEFSNGPFNAS
jgi:hypothetical protein